MICAALHFATPAERVASVNESWVSLWFRHMSRLEITTVADARALMLDDQPAFTDAAVARFAEGH